MLWLTQHNYISYCSSESVSSWSSFIAEFMQAVPLQLPQTMEHCIPCFLQVHYTDFGSYNGWCVVYLQQVCSNWDQWSFTFFPSSLFWHKIIACSFPLLHLVIHTIAVELGCSWRWWQSLGQNLGWVSGHVLSNMLVSYVHHSQLLCILPGAAVERNMQEWDGKKVKDHWSQLPQTCCLPQKIILCVIRCNCQHYVVYLQEVNLKGKPCLYIASACTLWQTAKIVGKAAGDVAPGL